MSRKLQQITNPLAKNAKLKLRKIFNVENKLRPLAREKTLLKTLGYTNLNEMYYALTEIYNKDVEDINKRIDKQQKIVKSEKAKDIRTKISNNNNLLYTMYLHPVFSRKTDIILKTIHSVIR